MDRCLPVALALFITAPLIGVDSQTLETPDWCVSVAGPAVRRYRMSGFAAFFPVNRTAMEQIVSDFRDTVFGGDDVEMSLTYLPHNGAIAAGLVLAALTTEWTYYDRNLMEKVDVKRDALYMSAPIQNNGNTRLLNVGELSNSESVNWNSNFQVDSIDVERVDTDVLIVLYRLDEDVLSIIIDFHPSCANDVIIDGVSPTDKVFARFPGVFDWGCDDIGWNTVEYCEKLKKDRCAIDSSSGNVCVSTKTISSVSCPVNMTIVDVTGVFRDHFPFLAESLPVTGFPGEWSTQELDVGITVPCFC